MTTEVIIIVIIIIIIIIIIITFLQGIYNYIPEMNLVATVYSVAAVQYLQFTVTLHYVTRNDISPVKYVLYLYVSTSNSLCAVHNMAVFCSSRISCFSCMLLRYCLSYFEMVPVAPINTGITFAFKFHMR
jgi:hypothetical protein